MQEGATKKQEQYIGNKAKSDSHPCYGGANTALPNSCCLLARSLQGRESKYTL